ncbi:MAG: glucan biosynthesis protein [Verrucomicrobiota bacterium]|nr:glucan biosynthesis protein [Verrucomicrobiota bacterium]
MRKRYWGLYGVYLGIGAGCLCLCGCSASEDKDAAATKKPAAGQPARVVDPPAIAPAAAPGASQVAREPGSAFGYADAVALAKGLAGRAHDPKADAPDDFFLKLTYDEYRDIRSVPEKRLWAGSGGHFTADFFHTGFIYNRLVHMDELREGKDYPIAYDRQSFSFGRLYEGRQLPASGGFAGLRVFTDLYRGAGGGHVDEVVVFQGASYFRAVSQGSIYGLSARGLAIDTIGGKGEEFPSFTRFWMERPDAGSTSVTVLALLESQRATGAYRFIITPGRSTITDVEATIFLREKVAMLGLAPLTSMFWFGEGSWPKPPEFRPEVHDSDGLLIAEPDGTHTWRPLDLAHATMQLRHTVLQRPKGVRGFGLLQRDQDFRNYLDLEAEYHRRPSAWIESVEGLDAGAIHLVEIHTGEETWDNIVALWEPALQPAPGESLHLRYRLHWGPPEVAGDPASKILETRRTGQWGPRRELIVLEVSKPAGFPTGKMPEVRASGVGASVQETHVFENTVTGNWRVAVRFLFPDDAKEATLRAQLFADGAPLSERWEYLWKP